MMVPPVPCYMCGKDFEPNKDQVDNWFLSGDDFDPTDWSCVDCKSMEAAVGYDGSSLTE